MDEYTKKWFFFSWIEEREEKIKMMKEFGCFVGGFSNPEMAKQIREREDGRGYELSDEEFDNSTKFVEDSIRNKEEELKTMGGRKRYRKIYLR